MGKLAADASVTVLGQRKTPPIAGQPFLAPLARLLPRSFSLFQNQTAATSSATSPNFPRKRGSHSTCPLVHRPIPAAVRSLRRHQSCTRGARNANSPSRARSNSGNGEKRSGSTGIESLKKLWV